MTRPLRSVGGQLSLALLLVVAIALGVVYEAVVPSLENRLVNSRVSQLQRAARSLARSLPPSYQQADFVNTASASTNARVVVMRLLSTLPPFPQPVEDSRLAGSSADVQFDPIAIRTLVTERPQHGTVDRGDHRYAEAAVYVPDQSVALFLTDSLENQLSSVHQVQRRLLLAAGAGLLIALLARLRRRLDLRAPYQAARTRRRPDLQRSLRRAGAGLGRRGAAATRRRVRAHARAPGAARRCAARVCRQRLARAADAAVLAGRLSRTARRRGDGRGDAAGVPHLDAGAGRPPDEAGLRSARPDPPGRGPAHG